MTKPSKPSPQEDVEFSYKYGFSMKDTSVFKMQKGISSQVVSQISHIKKEPKWMTDFRLKSYKIFLEKKMPESGGDLSHINFDDIVYFVRSTDSQKSRWEDLPAEIKETYDKIGVPEAEKKFLAGVSAQYDSEVVYESVQKELGKKGVIFCDMDTAVRKYPKLVKKYFGTLIPSHDNKFAALNSAVWSGGSFVYVQKDVKVGMPLQAYFRINSERFGQFERTLIIAEKGSDVHYIEGCLPIGEQICNGTSWVNIESVQPEDFVMTHKGTLSKVTKTMLRKYKGKMYTIQPLSPFNTFQLTEEHPVWSIKRETVLIKRKVRNTWLSEVDTQKLVKAKPAFIPVKDLKKGDFLIFPKQKDTSLGKTNLSDAEIELLGYYTAEGSTSYNRAFRQYYVTFTFSENEKHFVDRVVELTKKIINKKPSIFHDKKKHALVTTVYSESLYHFCALHCGRYAHSKNLSEEIMNLPTEKISLFYDAYFNGDGNTAYRKSKKNSTLNRASTASPRLASQLQILLSRIGIYSSILIRKGGPDIIQGRNIYRRDQYVITYTLNRTWSTIRETDEYYIIPIRSVTSKAYHDYVCNIEVEGAETYLVKGFVVHNCTAPIYVTDSLHAAVVEIFVHEGAHVRYTTVQNWSNNVYNLVTKRAKAYKNALMEWIDCNIGSKLTMKYPSVYLMEEGARGEVLSIAYAHRLQHQDAGAKMLHFAPNTSSRIVSKSISKAGGRTSYRGLVQVLPEAENTKVFVSCDALLLDEESRSDTYPSMKIKNNNVQIQHEATVEKIGEEKLFYLMSRGISRGEAEGVLVNGFIEPVAKEIPLEYSIELNRLMNLEMT